MCTGLIFLEYDSCFVEYYPGVLFFALRCMLNLKALSKKILVTPLHAAASDRWWEPSNRRMTRRLLNCCLTEPCWGSGCDNSGRFWCINMRRLFITYYFRWYRQYHIYCIMLQFWHSLWPSTIHIIQRWKFTYWRNWLAYEESCPFGLCCVHGKIPRKKPQSPWKSSVVRQ